MDPENIRPYKFSVHTILYNKDGFVVAYGKWENGPSRLAMRWDFKDSGFPTADGAPSWFQLPHEELWTNEILKGVMKIKNLERGAVIGGTTPAEV